MNAIAWFTTLSLVISVATPFALFLGRHVIQNWISKGIDHTFNVKIEQLRAELREKEEQLKSDLRDKEAEILVLRNNVLSGSANRQTLLDKRRFEAVETIWTAVSDFDQFRVLSAMMAALNFKALAQQADDPKIQTFLSTLGGAAARDPTSFKNVARNEQPFVTELAWAYFQAYTSILFGNVIRYHVLKTGLKDADKLVKDEGQKEILKAALPHQNHYIESQEATTYHYLLDEIQGLLLNELRNILEGKSADEEAANRAKRILKAVKENDQRHADSQISAAR